MAFHYLPGAGPSNSGSLPVGRGPGVTRDILLLVKLSWILGRFGFKLQQLSSISASGGALLGLPGAAHERSNAIRTVFKLNKAFEYTL